jgi:hypothetical protein
LKPTREAVTKKTRFEVFKRDGFRCQYCGNYPPAVTLEIDHINPVSKGGKSIIDNLITSCFDCNRGKSDIELTRIPNTLADNYEILQERELQIKQYNKLLEKIEKRVSAEIESVNQIFNNAYPKRILTDEFKRVTVKQFIKKLGLEETKESMRIACSKYLETSADTVKYFCGICWNKIRERNG